MTPQTVAGERFRRLHGAGTFILPNPADAGTARLLEQAGFEALATSSAAIAFSMGVKDGDVPRETMMQHITEIAAASSLPVSADLGDGFGRDPDDVAETIRLAAESGAVGGSIEDSTGDPRAPLLPMSLAVERITAAVEAARTFPFPFTVTARAEHFLVGYLDLDDALTRLAAYREAGADVLFAPCLPDAHAVAAAVEVAAPCALNVLAQGTGVSSSLDDLRALGVRRISLGSGIARAAFATVMDAIAELQQGRFDFLSNAIPLARMNELLGRAPQRAADA